MLKSIEATGATIELAIQAGLDQLQMDRDSVSVEVLEQPKKGFFGIGASPAKVSLTYEVPDPKPEKAPEPPKAQPKPEKQPGIETFMKGLLEHMGSDAVPSAKKVADDTYAVELIGEHLGMLIGRRGDTLDAIQHITNYAVNHGQNKRVRINVDAENYRKKREESLERLATKVAGKVVKTRRNITLEPMNAYERHVIHAALQDYPDVTTFSTGTEPGRRVVVAYSRYKSVEE